MAFKFITFIETFYFHKGRKPKDSSVAFNHPRQVSEALLQTFNTIMMINKTLSKCPKDQIQQFLSTIHREENQSSILSHSLKPNVYLVEKKKKRER